jgi:hypothetical protein
MKGDPANSVRALAETRRSKYVHRVAKIDLKGEGSANSVNCVRGSIVNYYSRSAATSTDKAKIRGEVKFTHKSPKTIPDCKSTQR